MDAIPRRAQLTARDANDCEEMKPSSRLHSKREMHNTQQSDARLKQHPWALHFLSQSNKWEDVAMFG